VHSYSQLQDAKENFLEEFAEMAGKYRLPQLQQLDFTYK
jgi:hypothetical protein